MLNRYKSRGAEYGKAEYGARETAQVGGRALEEANIWIRIDEGLGGTMKLIEVFSGARDGRYHGFC